MDDRNLLSIAFLAISDRYATLFFSSQNGCRRPFWMTENHFRSYFSPFQINAQLFFFAIWLPAAILYNRKSILITFLAISDQYVTLFFVHKIGCSGHFSVIQNGCRRPFWITENRFRSHFSPFQVNKKLFFKFSQNGCHRPFWMTEKSLSNAFLAISDHYNFFF